MGYNHMSRLPNGEAATGVSDDLPDAPLFQFDLVPKWSQDIVEFFISGVLNEVHARRHAVQVHARRHAIQVIRQAQPHNHIN